MTDQNVNPTDTEEAEKIDRAVIMLDDLFGRSVSPMLLVDDDRVYRNANQASCELLSGSREDIVGKRIEDFTDLSLREQVPALFTAFLQAGSLAGNFTMLDVNGQPVECSYSASANVVPGLHLSIMVPHEISEPELDISDEETTGSGSLTDREKEVLSLLALGETNATIADQLHLSPETVRSHTRSARLRLGARSRSHAIALALQSGQLDLS
jgi:DNA-binding CsgD family transcriptional regulator